VRALKLLFGALTAVGVTALALVAFAPFDGCALPDFTLAETSGSTGATGSTGGDDAPTGPPMCMHATYPPPPGGPDQGPDIGTIVVAIHTIELGDTSSTPPGYDLDGVCTCIDDGGPSCTGRSVDPTTYCDAMGGIDDQTLLLVKLIQIMGSGTFGSVFFSDEAGGGKWTLLIEIAGYNGTANDPVVQVAVYPSPGFVPNDAGAPEWDGTDAWNVSSTSLVKGDGGPNELSLDGGSVGDGGLVARYQSNGAYVSGGVLVASLPQSQIIFQGGLSSSVFQLTLSEGVLTGTLMQNSTPQGVVWSITNGIIAARWALTDVFNDVASFRMDGVDPICTSSPFYSVAKSAVCNDADILVNANDPASTPCDALSFGLGFTADPANIGPVLEPVDAGTSGSCAPGTSPAGDTCPSP
jgi:hypothetical protein